jgi:hypothetical protein
MGEPEHEVLSTDAIELDHGPLLISPAGERDNPPWSERLVPHARTDPEFGGHLRFVFIRRHGIAEERLRWRVLWATRQPASALPGLA